MATFKAVSYAFEQKCGLVFVEENHEYEMGDCVDFFTRIDPTVNRIDVVSGDLIRHIYLHQNDGWVAKTIGMYPQVSDLRH